MIVSPSLVDDDAPTPPAGSIPSTPPSVTSGPRIEMREPNSHGRGSSAKGKAPKRTINLQDIRFQSSRGRKERSRRSDEAPPRAHFADDEGVTIDGSDATIRPTSPTRRGRVDTPSPSIMRTPAPTGLASPQRPRMRRPPTE